MNFIRRHLADFSTFTRNAIWWRKRQLLKMDLFGQTRAKLSVPSFSADKYSTCSSDDISSSSERNEHNPSNLKLFQRKIHEVAAAMSSRNASQLTTSESSADKSICSDQKLLLRNEDLNLRIISDRDGTLNIDHHLGHVLIDNQRHVRATFHLVDR